VIKRASYPWMGPAEPLCLCDSLVEWPLGERCPRSREGHLRYRVAESNSGGVVTARAGSSPNKPDDRWLSTLGQHRRLTLCGPSPVAPEPNP